jgi:hypothetical protein
MCAGNSADTYVRVGGDSGCVGYLGDADARSDECFENALDGGEAYCLLPVTVEELGPLR